MDEKGGLAGGTTNNVPQQQQQPDTKRATISSKLPTFRSTSLPLSSPLEMYTRHQRDTHDSLRPPLLRPVSVIPHKEANIGYKADFVIPQGDRIGNFRRLIGIDSDPTHAIDAGYHRPAENVGIYTRIVREEVVARARYTRFSIIINTSLFAQIIVAAALTALGAGDGPRQAVTAFGAINTVNSPLFIPCQRLLTNLFPDTRWRPCLP